MSEDERDGTAIQARFDGPDFARIEDWRRSQTRIPPLAETVRMLVKRGLDAERRSTQRCMIRAKPTNPPMVRRAGEAAKIFGQSTTGNL